jgi:hypothetical protein
MQVFLASLMQVTRKVDAERPMRAPASCTCMPQVQFVCLSRTQKTTKRKRQVEGMRHSELSCSIEQCMTAAKFSRDCGTRCRSRRGRAVDRFAARPERVWLGRMAASSTSPMILTALMARAAVASAGGCTPPPSLLLGALQLSGPTSDAAADEWWAQMVAFRSVTSVLIWPCTA